MSSVYRIWDYPWDNGYILMEEFTDMAWVIVVTHLSADTFTRFVGIVSGMRRILRAYVVFARIRKGGGGSPAAADFGISCLKL
jgi:hypothetical protein